MIKLLPEWIFIYLCKNDIQYLIIRLLLPIKIITTHDLVRFWLKWNIVCPTQVSIWWACSTQTGLLRLGWFRRQVALNSGFTCSKPTWNELSVKFSPWKSMKPHSFDFLFFIPFSAISKPIYGWRSLLLVIFSDWPNLTATHWDLNTTR